MDQGQLKVFWGAIVPDDKNFLVATDLSDLTALDESIFVTDQCAFDVDAGLVPAVCYEADFMTACMMADVQAALARNGRQYDEKSGAVENQPDPQVSTHCDAIMANGRVACFHNWQPCFMKNC